MELMENGAVQLESNMLEQSENPSDSAQDQRYDRERCVSDTAEQKEMTGAQIVLAQEKLQETGEIGTDGEISNNKVTQEQERTLENVRIDLDSTYLEVASQSRFTCLEHMSIPSGTNGKLVPLNVEATNDYLLLGNDDSGSSGINPGCGKLASAMVEARNDSVPLENDDRGPSGVDPGYGKVSQVKAEATSNSVFSENDDRGSSKQRRNKKAKLKGPVTSSWVLRPKSQEKTKSPEPVETIKEGSANGKKKRRGIKTKNMQSNNINETKSPEPVETVIEGSANGEKKRRGIIPKNMQNNNINEKTKSPEPVETVIEGSANGEKKRRGRKPKNMQNNNINEFSRTRTQLRYLLHRIGYEQNLIDAYSAEGWRGQSLDKLKPEKELEKAKSRILNYKMKIRALFQSLDQSLALGKLPESLFDSQGEIDSEDIFCAKCGSKDLTLDNDIILCDGACERGFHQFCLEPPLLKTDIPPGDESWLCPGCDCKADCIDTLKDIHATKISIVDNWEKIFPEAAAAASGKRLDDGSGSSSDDSEDEEYDPDKPDSPQKVAGDKSSSDESSHFSASDELTASHNKEKYLGLPSDDSEDDDFDPSATDKGNQVKQDSSSSDFTSDSEDLEALIEDETALSEDPLQASPTGYLKQNSIDRNEEIFNVGRKKGRSLKDELSYLMEASAELLSSKRHVERLDYKKLNDETYGNSSSDSSDEDFDDTITRKRRRTGRNTSEAEFSDGTYVTPSNTHKEAEKQIEKKRFPKRTGRTLTDGDTTESSAKAGSPNSSAKRCHKRLGEATTQRLLASFNENQYPKKAVKENLAKELGLEVRQVGKWFENARWSFNHRPRMDSDSAEPPPASSNQNHIPKEER